MMLYSKYACSPDTWTMEILYWVHRQLAQWIENQYHSDVPVPFTVDALFNHLSTGDHWSRGMPLEYIPARLLPPDSSRSTVSGLTQAPAPAPAPAPGPPAADPEKGDTVLRPASHTVAPLAAFKAKQGQRKLGAIIAAAYGDSNHVPLDKDKQHFCLAYHVLGKCNSACKRARNHRKLTDAEVTSVSAFCEIAF
jgi:hypothetical protein